MNSLDLIVNEKCCIEQANYMKKGKDIDFIKIIKNIHKLMDENKNIKFEHCYSHLDWKDYISIGNRYVDNLASKAMNTEELKRQGL